MFVTQMSLDANMSKTVSYRDSAPIGHELKISYCYSNGHVKFLILIMFGPYASKTAGDRIGYNRTFIGLNVKTYQFPTRCKSDEVTHPKQHKSFFSGIK